MKKMSGLQRFLKDKSAAIVARNAKRESGEPVSAFRPSASVRVADRSGVREIRIRNFQVISDSGEDFAGYNLGPSSPELQLGVLGSCISHITLVQAAQLGIKLDSVEAVVSGSLHPFAGQTGYENIPIYPHQISYKLKISSPEPQERIQELYQVVEATCPILNLLVKPQHIEGKLEYKLSEE